MSQIVTLTLSPAVDLSTSVERLEPEHKLRCGPARRDPGGGGINVARMAHRLGARVIAVYPSGGLMGEALDRLLAAEELPRRTAATAAETRQNFYVDERATGRQFKFVLPGASLAPEAQTACLRALRLEAGPGDYVVCSGGPPEGAAPELYARVVREAKAAGAHPVIDTHGPSLAAGLAEQVYLAKPSLRELEDLVGASLPDDASRMNACADVIRSGQSQWVALSLGADGALLVGRTRAWRASAPKVEAQSSVGAGDSFLAGLVVAFAAGAPPAVALQQAVAVGTAAVLSPGTALAHPARIAGLAAGVEVRALELSSAAA